MSLFTDLKKIRESRKEEKVKQAMKKLVLDNPLTIEAVGKICEEFQYSWRYTAPDGGVFEFWKKQERQEDFYGLF